MITGEIRRALEEVYEDAHASGEGEEPIPLADPLHQSPRCIEPLRGVGSALRLPRVLGEVTTVGQRVTVNACATVGLALQLAHCPTSSGSTRDRMKSPSGV
jgi:hypothetical protein